MTPVRERWVGHLPSRLFIILFDSILGGLWMLSAIRWRYVFEQKPVPSDIDLKAALVFFAVIPVIWLVLRIDRAIWRFTSIDDIKSLLEGVLTATIVTTIILFLFFSRAEDFPRSMLVLTAVVYFSVLVAARLFVTVMSNGDVKSLLRRKNGDLSKAILIGSPTALHDYLRDSERKSGGLSYNVIGLSDRRNGYAGRSIRGVSVLNGEDELKLLYASYKVRGDEAPTLIAVDTDTDPKDVRHLIKLAAELGAPLVRAQSGHPDEYVPYDMSDLIGRPSEKPDITPVERLVKGKTVMITGAGGSIGSELSRHIARLAPETLLLVESSEYNLYRVNKTLTGAAEPYRDNTKIVAFLGDIRDRGRLEQLFRQHRPDIVLHAAAVKHVPIGEENPIETLKTNVLGTRNLIEFAEQYGTQNFTLISTDKAVDPSNIMGVSKRIAEILTLNADRTSRPLSCSAVRFGNVLASAGSVVPLFEEQIEAGGPVTITHPDMDRYFMTTEEAASLVLQSTALHATHKSNEGSVYVLEMGEPVKIVNLARQLIRLYGLVPDKDIKISYTGLRPGEKLSEVLFGSNEVPEKTYVNGVKRIYDPHTDITSLTGDIDRLVDALHQRDIHGVVSVIRRMFPTYDFEVPLTAPEQGVQSANIISISESKKTR